jgi:hypothetical protein
MDKKQLVNTILKFERFATVDDPELAVIGENAKNLRKSREKGDIDGAIWFAFLVGKSFGGDKEDATWIRLAKGSEKARTKKSEIKDKHYAEIRAAVQEELNSNPKNTLNHARELAADRPPEFWSWKPRRPVSFDTVKRATAGMKGRKKNKK